MYDKYPTIYYDKNGQECNEDDVVFAKDEKSGYYILFFNGGLRHGQIFDISSQYYTPNMETATDKKTGDKYAILKKVGKECFQQFLLFLQTKNSARLKTAERFKNEKR